MEESEWQIGEVDEERVMEEAEWERLDGRE
jgi:hypothetical protein